MGCCMIWIQFYDFPCYFYLLFSKFLSATQYISKPH